jgi:CubicO group peptidase (beta-lactamase class C family)
MAPFDAARALIRAGLDEGAFPAAAIEVGRRGGPIWQEAFGAGHSTIFDLASLTKVIATTSLVMRAIADDRLTLVTPLDAVLPTWRGLDRGGVLIRHLLDHSSGLPAHARLFERMTGREAFETAICAMPLEHAPGSASVYSDVGFMLLGFILEDLRTQPLDAQFDALALTGSEVIRFRPPADLIDRIAPTEDDPWRGRMLRGEVHDENAAALGGVAGHAGLFGTVTAVGSFARTVLDTFAVPTALGDPALMKIFASRTGVPGSSRALGWDTMKPTSSCGTLMSPAAIGHTGYTGTSLWIDRDGDVYVALLTNRVHPTRRNEALNALRPRIHDAIMREL